MIVAATGLAREARIVAGPGIKTVIGGANSRALQRELERAIAEGADGIISIGIAGGLAPSLKPGDCVIGSEIVTGKERVLSDAAWTARMSARVPDATIAPMTGTDVIVTDEAEKAALFRATGAYAVDMESHIAARLAAAQRIPFAVLRVVSDPANRTLPPLVSSALTSAGNVNYRAVAKALLTEPRQITGLVKTARESKFAFDALLRCRDALGLRLAGPDGREPALNMR